MLDKHIHRHVSDSLKEGVYQCAECAISDNPFSVAKHEEMYEHFRVVHAIGVVVSNSSIDENTAMEIDTPKKTINASAKPIHAKKLNAYLNDQSVKENLFTEKIIPPTIVQTNTADLFFAAAAQQIIAAQKAFMTSTK